MFDAAAIRRSLPQSETVLMSKHLQRDIESLNNELAQHFVDGRGDDRQGDAGPDRAAVRPGRRGRQLRRVRRSARSARRGRVPEDAGPAPAGGGRSAADRDGDEGQQRPGADRRPGGEHRPAGPGDGRVSGVSRFPSSCRGWSSWRRRWSAARWTPSSTWTPRPPGGSSRWTRRSTSYNRDIIDELQALMQKRPEAGAGGRALLFRRAAHRADRRPRHEHRRRRDLPGGRRHRPPPARASRGEPSESD